MSHVVEVNEGVVEVSQQGLGWWQLHRPRFAASGSLREVVPACFIGGTVELGPYAEDDARFMADHMVNVGGMPRTALRVKRASR
jgi:hypothetical protein